MSDLKKSLSTGELQAEDVYEDYWAKLEVYIDENAGERVLPIHPSSGAVLEKAGRHRTQRSPRLWSKSGASRMRIGARSQ